MARRRGYTEEQILAALRHSEGGTTVVEVCRQVGITEQTFYTWKRKYAGLGMSELREEIATPNGWSRISRLIDICCRRLPEINLYGLGTGGLSPAGRK